ncbi:TPA: hypothetical protein NR353_001600 [Legionella pneumophila]|uniref:Uncharacterized protein n=1 Tax=Legionella waltersii TaxID=66969 RepID=A0A0W1AGQ5_9GAMM|nr:MULTISPECIES: hypothetical protein [Legionella]KTD80430.1 hypothetical protein Lwal_1127 [Legionella waltersii]MBN5936062.1 hypothetical protein [Legionella anisa]SNV10044.1 Uncharacterised protein [Legionella waltersii]HAT1130430.1 hypothetical protein [Legionella pneumophila]HAT1919940.1 hypothetical protein [Legionella pneumophila]
MSRRKADITEPIAPHRVKDTEKDRLNPGYFRIKSGDRVVLREDIVYLWSYNSQKELVIGIEYPWQYPEIFNVDMKNEQEKKIWNSICAQLQGLIEGIKAHHGFGHPTLAAEFNSDGQVKVGLAHLGGELKCINGEWIIDNRSGRFGRYDEVSADIRLQIENTINEVASIFQEANIKVTPKLHFKNPAIFSSKEQKETTFFKKTDESKDNNIESIEKKFEY